MTIFFGISKSMVEGRTVVTLYEIIGQLQQSSINPRNVQLLLGLIFQTLCTNMCLLLVSRSIFDVVYIYASCVLNCDDLVIYDLVL